MFVATRTEGFMMDNCEYEGMRMELEKKLHRAREQVEKLETALRGFELAFEIVGATSDIRGAEVRQAVKQTALKFDHTFGVKDVLESLQKTGINPLPKRSSVSGVLSDLVESSVLELVEQGKGRKPSLYSCKDIRQQHEQGIRLAQ